MQDTKHARIIRSLKQLTLSSRTGVSRAEAAKSLQIDLRTASFYLEQLADLGLLRSEKTPCIGKGRPHVTYRSNADNLCFLGLQILNNLTVSAVVIDASGRELQHSQITLPENMSRLSAFSCILQLVNQFKDNGNGKLYGIGMAISRWLQPPLAGEDVYANLADFLERETGLAVHRDVNINTLAFAQAKQLNCHNLAIVHPGNVIEFGLVRDGLPDVNFAKREAWLSHVCVNPDGRRCYCGKHGCLENYVTHGARHERLLNNNKSATLKTLGTMLGIAMVRLVRKYPVETLLLLGAEELFPAAEEYFKTRIPSGVNFYCKRNSLTVDYGAALMSAHFELHRFTEEYNNQPLKKENKK